MGEIRNLQTSDVIKRVKSFKKRVLCGVVTYIITASCRFLFVAWKLLEIAHNQIVLPHDYIYVGVGGGLHDTLHWLTS